MKHWYCATITPEDFSIRNVLDECEGIEKDGYKVEQITYVDGQYQIFYSIVEEDDDE